MYESLIFDYPRYFFLFATDIQHFVHLFYITTVTLVKFISYSKVISNISFNRCDDFVISAERLAIIFITCFSDTENVTFLS